MARNVLPVTGVQGFVTRSDHRYSAKRLDAWVDGELAVLDTDRVVGHLIECEDCSDHVRFLLRIRGALLYAYA